MKTDKKYENLNENSDHLHFRYLNRQANGFSSPKLISFVCTMEQEQEKIDFFIVQHRKIFLNEFGK